ncbi:MAG: UDP-3-O-[3-hydroxymyristoyl] N-acetylglucosamine deacetylase [Alphaproteobacteria bacterium]|nr:MAG: UDP-3-O-[3-hydroxymyristoyl] N-acetylglucosamine deacetylase [Alphaproteobacteria bacterium]
MQHTLQSKATIRDIGLHSGAQITMHLIPAEENHGIVFVRTDITEGDNVIPARWDSVVDTQLCTVIGNDNGARVGTIEHLMSALRGCGVDNLTIEIDGGEVPAMDGSAMPFLEVIEDAGLKTQSLPKRAIRVLKEVCVEDNGKSVTLKPDEACVFAGEIEFDHGDIGYQRFETQLVNGNFKHDIAQARTFGFLHEVEYMRAQGLGLGGSLDNAIILDTDGVMNPDGLRFTNEFIRHKLLDAIGDLYLAGGHILGLYYGVKAGHAINNAILHALFASDDNWEYVDLPVAKSQTTHAPCEGVLAFA